ncbi:hypothetical protein LDO26_09405 [Luteimonas sp. BDR2-5]|uniref:dioxygenase family protein n=1 Tax=Proluteimonas luteida TaxID=2878685 RepID=UPI001E3076A8|nr:hypothetical protein [Luteimonas sp. BDR2-5]MCD9028424.1 hypothetical protein [Luteimonas sp. BDR2-5]
MRQPPLSPIRRNLLKAAGSVLLVAPGVGLLACGSKSPASDDADGQATDDPAADTDGADAPPWASGGTAAIGDPARFPDPFAGVPASACVLTCMTTIGPCHTTSPERADISDGWDGLPLRLALRVVDSACQPVAGVLVEVWHTNYTGGYSGRIAAMCNNDEADIARQFFRGYLRTDADGRVDFDTCYPGWYSSRAVHIHLRVLTGDYDADDRAVSAVTTQLLFTDALNGEIFSTHPLYAPLGLPDTPLDDDNVVGGEADKRPYLFDVQRMDDGVMFASKTLVVRQSDEEQVCQAKGAGRPGGPGGPGGPFDDPDMPRRPPPDGMPPPRGTPPGG